MADKFPGPYRNSVPQDVDRPDPMIERVPFSYTGVGARKSIMPSIKNDQTIVHAPNMNSK
jgi:hypothetical protein